jgi:hypothetical protein
MRTRAALLSAAIVLTFAAGADAGDRLAGLPRVRPLNEQAASLVADAQQKSPTVRDLLNKLETGDVVAYIQVVPARRDSPESTLLFVSATAAVRYVLIQVSDCQAPCRGLELLGHELQHATDVASRPWVTDDGQLQRMLAMTGWRDASTARGYETPDAMQAERRVHRDVRGVAGTIQ